MTVLTVLAVLLVLWLVVALAVGLVLGGVVRVRDRVPASVPKRPHEGLRLVG